MSKSMKSPTTASAVSSPHHHVASSPSSSSPTIISPRKIVVIKSATSSPSSVSNSMERLVSPSIFLTPQPIFDESSVPKAIDDEEDGVIREKILPPLHPSPRKKASITPRTMMMMNNNNDENEALHRRRFYELKGNNNASNNNNNSIDSSLYQKHFDVVMKRSENVEKLDDYMRFYYTDFLSAAPAPTPMFTADGGVDIDSLARWVQGANPRTRVDAYPLLVVAKDLLYRLVEGKLHFAHQELDDTKQALGIVEEELREARNEWMKINNELTDTKQTLADREGEIARMAADMDIMLKEKAEFDQKIASLHETIGVMQNLHKEVETKLQAERELSANRAAEIKKWKLDHRQLEIDLANMTALLETTKKEMQDGFEKEKDAWNRNLANVHDEMAALRVELKAALNEIETLKFELEIERNKPPVIVEVPIKPPTPPRPPTPPPPDPADLPRMMRELFLNLDENSRIALVRYICKDQISLLEHVDLVTLVKSMDHPLHMKLLAVQLKRLYDDPSADIIKSLVDVSPVLVKGKWEIPSATEKKQQEQPVKTGDDNNDDDGGGGTIQEKQSESIELLLSLFTSYIRAGFDLEPLLKTLPITVDDQFTYCNYVIETAMTNGGLDLATTLSRVLVMTVKEMLEKLLQSKEGKFLARQLSKSQSFVSTPKAASDQQQQQPQAVETFFEEPSSKTMVMSPPPAPRFGLTDDQVKELQDQLAAVKKALAEAMVDANRSKEEALGALKELSEIRQQQADEQQQLLLSSSSNNLSGPLKQFTAEELNIAREEALADAQLKFELRLKEELDKMRHPTTHAEMQTDPIDFGSSSFGNNKEQDGSASPRTPSSKKKAGATTANKSKVNVPKAFNLPKSKTAIKPVPVKTMLTLCASLFQEKVTADEADDRINNRRQDLAEFARDHLIMKFGLRSLALKQLQGLIQTVNTKAAEFPRLRVFGYLSGLTSGPEWDPAVCNFALYCLQKAIPKNMIKEKMDSADNRIRIEILQDAVSVAFASCPWAVGNADSILALMDEVALKEGNGEVLAIDLWMELLVNEWKSASQQRLRDLGELFDKFDVNKDKTLDFSEFKTMIATVAPNITDREIVEIYRDAVGSSHEGDDDDEDDDRIEETVFATVMIRHKICPPFVSLVSSAA